MALVKSKFPKLRQTILTESKIRRHFGRTVIELPEHKTPLPLFLEIDAFLVRRNAKSVCHIRRPNTPRPECARESAPFFNVVEHVFCKRRSGAPLLVDVVHHARESHLRH